jgi:outer membrane murein-binding lipoprotein Lpp
MKNKFIGLLLLSTLFMSMTSIALVGAQTSGKVVIHLKGALEADDNLNAAMVDYAYVEWSVVTEDITSSDLAGADMLVMIQADPAAEYTTSEISVITSWFDEGNKLLWVASDSDYPDGQELRIPDANAVLEAVGSKLRGENAETQDPLVNFDAAYRVKGVSTYCSEDYEFLVAGVTYAQFHGCGIIIGYLNGNYYALEETDIDGVHVIMTSSDSGVVSDESAPAPEAHSPGQEGAFAMMVLEEIGSNYVIATSDAPFSHYSAMYKPEIQNYARYGLETNPNQGAALFGNILDMAVRNGMGATISTLEVDVDDLEAEVSGLEDDVAGLTADVSDLEADVSTLESEKTALEADVTSLEADVSAAQSSASTMQLAAIAALVIGVVVGYFVGPMIKKQ